MTYKLLEDKETLLQGWEHGAAAQAVIEDARRRHDASTSPG